MPLPEGLLEKSVFDLGECPEFMAETENNTAELLLMMLAEDLAGDSRLSKQEIIEQSALPEGILSRALEILVNSGFLSIYRKTHYFVTEKGRNKAIQCRRMGRLCTEPNRDRAKGQDGPEDVIVGRRDVFKENFSVKPTRSPLRNGLSAERGQTARHF